MSNKVTIIMYHYVRDLKHSKYPEIKGLDISLFVEQIEFLKRYYHFISMENLIDAIQNNEKLPQKSVLLTFDDAYSDHFNYVFPILEKNNIQGSFFPPAKAITEHSVLDVNKIHFILASESDKSKIITEIKNELNRYRNEYSLETDAYYYEKLAKPNRFDSADVIFIKRLLQVELEEYIRKIITNNLFEKIVGIDEQEFSKDLYMGIEQLKHLQSNGMHIGSHGYNHFWLGSLSEEEQKKEIEQSISFLNIVGCDISNWTMCYPYGNYNSTTLDILAKHHCKLALTTEVGIADIYKQNKYTLPRLDTNDIPKDRESQPNNWYYLSED